MPKRDLEARITEITREFVTRLVHEIRNASFADVAALPGEVALPSVGGRPSPASAGRPGKAKTAGPTQRTRRSAQGRAEVAERVASALEKAGSPMGVRALADALGVSPDALAAPLRELRAAGRIRKHGDKRATKYSA